MQMMEKIRNLASTKSKGSDMTGFIIAGAVSLLVLFAIANSLINSRQQVTNNTNSTASETALFGVVIVVFVAIVLLALSRAVKKGK